MSRAGARGRFLRRPVGERFGPWLLKQLVLVLVAALAVAALVLAAPFLLWR